MATKHARLDGLRYRLEKYEIDRLSEKYGFVPPSNPSSLLNHHRMTVGSDLKITENLSPKLWRIFRESIEALGFEEPVELFVKNRGEWNAFALPGTDIVPHKIVLFSGIVRHHSPDELRFVIGHELGHLAFRHHHGDELLSKFPPDASGQPTAPSFLVRRVEVWRRWSEASCDRAGYVAAGRNMAAVTNVILAMASGLGPDWVVASEKDLEGQLVEIENAKLGDLIIATHPAPVVRLAALRHYAKFDDWDALDEKERQFSDTETFRILSLHDTTSYGLPEHTITFVVSGCILATRARNSELTPLERDGLLDWIAPSTDDPESYVCAGLESTNAELETMLLESAARLREDPESDHSEGLVAMVRLIVADGTCTDEERGVARLASEALGLGAKTVDFLIHHELAAYHRSAGTRPR
jgi:Peptidase family M48